MILLGSGRRKTELAALVLKVRVVVLSEGPRLLLAREHVLRAGEHLVHVRLVVSLSNGLLVLPLLASTSRQLLLLLLGSCNHNVAVFDDEVVVVAQVKLARASSRTGLILA